MSRGPSSSASVLAAIASPGRSPLEMARLGSGAFTELDSTNAIDPGPSIARATARATRRPPTKTDSKLDVHASSGVSMIVPVGGPPTEIRAPSRRPQVSRAAATSRSAVSGSALSPTTATAASPSSAGGLVEGVLVAAGEHDACSLGDEQVGAGAAEAATSAGDDVHAIGESEVHARPYDPLT